MNSLRYCSLLCLAALLLCNIPSHAQRGARVVPRNLAELVERSQTIVRGHVSSVRVEPHPDYRNISTLVIEFRVAATLKGSAQETMTIRQFIWDKRDRADAAGYAKGQEYLLMLNRPTRLGLQSTVGLSQGSFRIVNTPGGVRKATNGYGNRGLFEGLDDHVNKSGVRLSPRASRTIASPTSEVTVDALQELIIAFVEAQ